ncbi:MAG TPA: type VI secretion system protein TssA [Acetobacteraceae bacterium]|nr:type VI secretion system protein TssA [Acetobacteraceae bacterium]HUC64044.1 type VI secretion system protein TssA [Stellaceae bacterium]
MSEITSDAFDALLAPAPDGGAGPDLRGDTSPQSLYYRLRDARAEARAAERAADAEDDGTAAPPAPWRDVASLAQTALGQSKDLEIAAWYSEALLRSDGMAGLAAGFALMGGLVERYWDELHPLPDEDGITTRVAPVGGLNGEGAEGTLIQPLRKLTLFHRPDGAPLAFWQYEQAAEVSALGDAQRREQRLAAGVLPFDTVETEAQAAGAALARLRDATLRAATAWDGLAAALDARAGTDAPPMRRVRDLLTQIAEAASRYAPSAATEPDAVTEMPLPVPGGTVTPFTPGTIATREEALARLDEVAVFFRRTEPHSPLAYTLTEAVRRARLTWPELLAEIVPDQDARAAILTTLGIRPPPTA